MHLKLTNYKLKSKDEISIPVGGIDAEAEANHHEDLEQNCALGQKSP